MSSLISLKKIKHHQAEIQFRPCFLSFDGQGTGSVISLHSHWSSFVSVCLPFFMHTIIIVPPGLARKYMWNCFCILLRQNKANQNHWGSHTWYSNKPLPPFILCQALQAPFVLCFINLKGQKSKKSVAKETCQTIVFHERLSWRFLLISSDPKKMLFTSLSPSWGKNLTTVSLSSDTLPLCIICIHQSCSEYSLVLPV